MTLMVDYWLAARLGRVWLRLHKGLRVTLDEMPSECALVARGQRLQAARLYRAQGFAARVWWRAGMAAFVLAVPLAAALTASIPGRLGTDVGVGLILVVGCLAGVAMLQMGLLSFRSAQTRLYLQQAGPQAAEDPLPQGSLGVPTPWDFWVMVVIALGVFGILAYAGFH